VDHCDGRNDPEDALVTAHGRVDSRREVPWIDLRRTAAALVVIAASVLSVVTVVWPHGAALSPDTATYAGAGRSLADGLGYLDYSTGQQMLDFPPLYSMLLAMGFLTGLQVSTTSAVAGVVCATALGLIVFRWCRILELPLALATVVAVIVVLLPPINDSMTSALSEQLFIVLSAGTMLLVTQSVASQLRSWRYVGALTIVLAAACLTRYAGVALVVGAGVALLWRPDRWSVRVLRSLAVMVVAAIPLGLWLTRNRELTGRATANDYAPSAFPWFHHLRDDLAGIGGWFVTDQVSTTLSLVVGALAFCVPVAIIIAGLLLARYRVLVPASVVVVVYCALIVVGQSLIGLDTDDRYVRPVAPALVALAAAAATRLPIPTGWAVAAASTGGAALGFVMCACLISLDSQISTASGAGLPDYNTTRWRDSAVVAYVRTHPSIDPTIANDPYAAYLLAGSSVDQSPAATYDNSNTPTGDLRQFVNDVKGTPTRIVWFNNADIGYLETLATLKKSVCTRTVASLADGQVLETCSPDSGSSAVPSRVAPYLSSADLRGADLHGSDLRGADLTGADLRGADLRGADLRHADLTGADGRGADLTGAVLTGATWYDGRVCSGNSTTVCR
jgi:hypothetical protein